jgi:hypothetical protein
VLEILKAHDRKWVAIATLEFYGVVHQGLLIFDNFVELSFAGH